MKLSREFRSLILELANEEIEASDGPDGIDKARWHAAVIDRLDTEWPQHGAALAHEARNILVWNLMGWLANHSTHPYLIRARETRDIARRAKRQREWVQIPVGGNIYRLKRFMDCNKREVAIVIDYYEKQKQHLQNKINWYREVYQQMELLADDALVADVVHEDRAA